MQVFDGCTYQLIRDHERLIVQIVGHKRCTAIKTVEFLVGEICGPHSGADKFLEGKQIKLNSEAKTVAIVMCVNMNYSDLIIVFGSFRGLTEICYIYINFPHQHYDVTIGNL